MAAPSKPDRSASGTAAPAVAYIARCPEHGLHGERDECFVCGGAVDHINYVRADQYTKLQISGLDTKREFEREMAALRAENEALKAERDENEHALRQFQAGLTDALRVHNVPAMPSWSEAIHWLRRDGYKRGVDAGARWTIARIRGEADETFDLALDSELRALADLIADEHANGKCSVESDEQERTDG